LQKVYCVADKRYDKNQVLIEYPHITKQQVLKPAEAKFIKLDLKTNSQKITSWVQETRFRGLTQMGYKVTLVNAEEITTEKLEAFDVIMTGIRAYNVPIISK
jgi:hypothetical protein